MTRFKIDENLPVELGALLAADGHDVHSVLDEGLRGFGDAGIADACRREGRALFTFDLDFANTLAFPPAMYPGIIVLRLFRQDRDHVVDVIGKLLPPLRSAVLDGQLWIVEETRVRIRQ